MRIYTKAGDLPFESFTFPDGQPHFKLLHRDEFNEATVEAVIMSPTDLFQLDLVAEVLRHNGIVPNLDIRYLMGARMDRRIDKMQPNTLGVVAHTINGMGFHKVRVLDVHSSFGEQAINAENVLPFVTFERVLKEMPGPDQTVVIIPDKGALTRVTTLLAFHQGWPYRQATKIRDMATGNLTGFGIASDASFIKGKKCLIVDDICDGGGTFTGLSKVLRDCGADTVDLFVTHGIFSKGLPLLGIDHVYTTNSTEEFVPGQNYRVKNFTVFPISMKEL